MNDRQLGQLLSSLLIAESSIGTAHMFAVGVDPGDRLSGELRELNDHALALRLAIEARLKKLETVR